MAYTTNNNEYAPGDGRVLIVTRASGMTATIDKYQGVNLNLRIQDNGALVIADGSIPVAAYPAGAWATVTPPQTGSETTEESVTADDLF